jgi:hypothetical protein
MDFAGAIASFPEPFLLGFIPLIEEIRETARLKAFKQQIFKMQTATYPK